MNCPGGSLPMIVFTSQPRPAERLGLQLRVLDDAAPEGPRVRDDDAHLHGVHYRRRPCGSALDTTGRSSSSRCRRSARWPRAAGAARTRRSCGRLPAAADRGPGPRRGRPLGAFTIFNFLTYGTTAVVARASGAGEKGVDARPRLAAQALWVAAIGASCSRRSSRAEPLMRATLRRIEDGTARRAAFARGVRALRLARADGLRSGPAGVAIVAPARQRRTCAAVVVLRPTPLRDSRARRAGTAIAQRRRASSSAAPPARAAASAAPRAADGAVVVVRALTTRRGAAPCVIDQREPCSRRMRRAWRASAASS